jgi:hypothetical protein
MQGLCRESEGVGNDASVNVLLKMMLTAGGALAGWEKKKDQGHAARAHRSVFWLTCWVACMPGIGWDLRVGSSELCWNLRAGGLCRVWPRSPPRAPSRVVRLRVL